MRPSTSHPLEKMAWPRATMLRASAQRMPSSFASHDAIPPRVGETVPGLYGGTLEALRLAACWSSDLASGECAVGRIGGGVVGTASGDSGSTGSEGTKD